MNCKKGGIAKNFRGRVSKCPKYVLEDKQASIGMLLTVQTSSKILKNKTKILIRNEVDGRAAKGVFDAIRDKPVDLCLHVSLNKARFKKQDLDNIQKVVFDAIKKDRRCPDRNYIVNDDSQIIRCIVYKTNRIEDECVDTDELTISAREHNPGKQMVLRKEPGINVKITNNKIHIHLCIKRYIMQKR